MRDVPWENIFKLGASAAANEFCEWVQVGIDIYISLIYFLKPHLTPSFSAAFAAVIVHRNLSFPLYQTNKTSDSKAKLRQAINCYKGIVEAAKFTYGNKTRDHHLPETWLSGLLINC